MASTFLERRAAPLGNSFENFDDAVPLPCGDLTDRALKRTWGLNQIGASRLRRHHSIGDFIPFALEELMESKPLWPMSSDSRKVKVKTGSSPAATSQRGLCETSSPSSDGCSPGSTRLADGSPGTSRAREELRRCGHNTVEACRQEFSYGSRDSPASTKKSRGHRTLKAGGSASPAAGAGPATTLMIRNLPGTATQAMLIEELDTSGFAGTYDFAYLPVSFDAKQSKGYAFVNFLSEVVARQFCESWRKSQRCGARGTVLNISPAACQGLEANVKNLDGPRMARIRNPALRPFVRMARSGALLPAHAR